MYYEDKNNVTIIDVPDEECAIWVESDYQRRLESAEDKQPKCLMNLHQKILNIKIFPLKQNLVGKKWEIN